VGIIIGPIIAALFTTVWEIYGEAFSEYLPKVGLTSPADSPQREDDSRLLLAEDRREEKNQVQ